MSIGVVVVTFNRISKLKTSLEHINNQSLKPEVVVIVDNASTDGTGDYLARWSSECHDYIAKVITMPENRGGSGGYYAGIEEVIKYPVDWVWLQDDDVYADHDAFAIAMESIRKIGDSNIVSISSKVISRGEISQVHRRYVKKSLFEVTENYCPLDSYDEEFFKLNLITFAGAFIRKSAIEKVGLPERDFFIWQDDTEYCYRLNKIGTLYCVPRVVIEHDVDEQQLSSLSWKSYYGWRNELIKYRKHFSPVVFGYKVIKRLIKGLFLFISRGSCCTKMWYRALIDGVKGVRGIHPVYKPGWTPIESKRE